MLQTLQLFLQFFARANDGDFGFGMAGQNDFDRFQYGTGEFVFGRDNQVQCGVASAFRAGSVGRGGQLAERTGGFLVGKQPDIMPAEGQVFFSGIGFYGINQQMCHIASFLKDAAREVPPIVRLRRQMLR